MYKEPAKSPPGEAMAAVDPAIAVYRICVNPQRGVTMDPDALSQIIHEIADHFRNTPEIRLIHSDPEVCFSSDTIKLMGSSAGGYGCYHISLCVDARVRSSSTGLPVDLQPVGLFPGLYWIAQSQGAANARIIAHIGSWNADGRSLYALVADY